MRLGRSFGTAVAAGAAAGDSGSGSSSGTGRRWAGTSGTTSPGATSIGGRGEGRICGPYPRRAWRRACISTPDGCTYSCPSWTEQPWA
ncbi:hypothetical protein [Streptosporangium saharense]|uniref:hypothetical protein n=1 Tax=Streptosporangium saharense TaxID=1706840 RepID=UPI0034422AE0